MKKTSMTETPITPIRLPIWIKKEIKKRTKNISAWIIQACIEKLNRES